LGDTGAVVKVRSEQAYLRGINKVIARIALSCILGLAAVALVIWLSNDLNLVADFYAKNIRASLFTGFLTVGSFLLSLKVFIVVKFKENIFDSDAYKKRLADRRKLNPELTHYGPVKRLSQLLFFAIISAIGASVTQLSIGLIPAWQATLVCVFAATFAGSMLICTLWLIRQILDDWLSYFEA
jgi:hypothetical protein